VKLAPQTLYFHLRVTPVLKRAVRRAAREAGTSVSAWLRGAATARLVRLAWARRQERRR